MKFWPLTSGLFLFCQACFSATPQTVRYQRLPFPADGVQTLALGDKILFAQNFQRLFTQRLRYASANALPVPPIPVSIITLRYGQRKSDRDYRSRRPVHTHFLIRFAAVNAIQRLRDAFRSRNRSLPTCGNGNCAVSQRYPASGPVCDLRGSPGSS